MRLPGETDEEFARRAAEARSEGICIFENDDEREFILDIIDDYLELYEAVNYHKEE